MNVLVLNCGSSSVKADVIDTLSGQHLRTGIAERVGHPQCEWRIGEKRQTSPSADHAAVLAEMLPALLDGLRVEAVGHRVVHGAQVFTAPTRIDDNAVQALRATIPLAPLHNPANIAGIEAARVGFPNLPNIAVFDTAFHNTLPRRAKTYALPKALSEKHGLRRYGFHGPSHQWVSKRAAEYLGEPIENLRIITCHLGNGASVCAVEYGRSVETSMGLTPVEGLVMGTRSGDVGAGVLLKLMREVGLDADGLDRMLNKESGLAGLTETSGDMRDIEARAAEGDDSARLAIAVFAHRLRKYIGAYAAAMGGVDAIVFTAGIGENSALIRHRTAQRLGFLGARLDEDKNRDAQVSYEHPVADISERNSRVRLLAIKTDESLAIAIAAAALVGKADHVDQTLRVPIAVSARHIHLTRDAIDVLFGTGHELTPYKPLSQPGQYASEEKLDIIGPKNTIKGVRVLGPARSKNQVEISRTDEFLIGVDAPVRNSGDVEHSPGVTLRGPAGQLTIEQGLICARRHIHMTPQDADRFGVRDGDVVSVALDTEGRDLTFGDVLIRVSPKYKLEMHIDTDEANAADLTPGAEGALVDTGSSARLLRKKLG